TQYSFPAAIDLFRLAFLGIICTAGAHSLFIQGMKKISASTAAIISSLEPVYGIILAYFLLKEVPSFRTLIGGIIILFSVTVITFKKPSP
ncbi:MAG: DMT family transporter, partial [Candidatus Aminicenantes bacterium]|nr:DMT family transporter [Candidatus Aminicenantes bacterium]